VLFLISYGFLTPPTIFIVLCLLGPLTALVWRRTGLGIALVSGVSLFATATPALSSYLMRQVEAEIPEYGDLGATQAIVVLGGDVRVAKGADNADELGPLSLERVIYTVDAYRQLHKPIAVSGGIIGQAHRTVGTLMKDMLETNFGIPVTWDEDESETTWGNAKFTARLLLPAGIKTVVVVTHSSHMPRALWCFEQVGLNPLPWPAPRSAPRWDEFADFLPNLNALLNTFYALHEMIGGVYYRLYYGSKEGT
jgi:uncharacterized SAM-binding protein YcdF (DUF218 family)